MLTPQEVRLLVIEGDIVDTEVEIFNYTNDLEDADDDTQVELEGYLRKAKRKLAFLKDLKLETLDESN